MQRKVAHIIYYVIMIGPILLMHLHILYIVFSLTHLTYQPIHCCAWRVTCSRGSTEGNTNAVIQKHSKKLGFKFKKLIALFCKDTLN